MICRTYILSGGSFRNGCKRCGHKIGEHQAWDEPLNTPGFVSDEQAFQEQLRPKGLGFPWEEFSPETLFVSRLPLADATMIWDSFLDGDLMRDYWIVDTPLINFLKLENPYHRVIVSSKKVNKETGEAYKEAIWCIASTSFLKDYYN